MHYQRGRKPPKIAPAPWDCATPPDEDQATAIGDVHKKFGKDRATASPDCNAADCSAGEKPATVMRRLVKTL